MIARRTEDEDALFLWSDGSVVSRYIGFWEVGQPDYKSGICTKVLGPLNSFDDSKFFFFLKFLDEKSSFGHKKMLVRF